MTNNLDAYVEEVITEFEEIVKEANEYTDNTPNEAMIKFVEKTEESLKNHNHSHGLLG